MGERTCEGDRKNTNGERASERALQGGLGAPCISLSDSEVRKAPSQSSWAKNSPGSWWNTGISRGYSAFVPFVGSEGGDTGEGLLG